VAGDPTVYAVVTNRSGESFALTPTCAANALEVVAADAHAHGSAAAARRGFAALGVILGCDWKEAARTTLDAAAGSIATVVAETGSEFDISEPEIIGLGGGAGALVPAVAAACGRPHRMPRDAEVISSVGDALSLVRAELERSLPKPTPGAIRRLHRDAEDAAIAAGASPSTVRVESAAVPERNALRVVATGSVALEAGAVPRGAGSAGPHIEGAGSAGPHLEGAGSAGPHIEGEPPADVESVRLAAKSALAADPILVASTGFYTVFSSARGEWAVIDRHGSLVVAGRGPVLTGTGLEVEELLGDAVVEHVRHIGPLSVAPAVRILRGSHLVDLSPLSSAEDALDAAVTECRRADGDGVVAFLSRS
jgi:Hydantoinase/oxoprolinase